jgi:hypothetical protein
MCVRHGVDVIYHASYIDDEGMDMLEKNKTKHIVAPGINWLVATRKSPSSPQPSSFTRLPSPPSIPHSPSSILRSAGPQDRRKLTSGS